MMKLAVLITVAMLIVAMWGVTISARLAAVESAVQRSCGPATMEQQMEASR